MSLPLECNHIQEISREVILYNVGLHFLNLIRKRYLHVSSRRRHSRSRVERQKCGAIEHFTSLVARHLAGQCVVCTYEKSETKTIKRRGNLTIKRMCPLYFYVILLVTEGGVEKGHVHEQKLASVSAMDLHHECNHVFFFQSNARSANVRCRRHSPSKNRIQRTICASVRLTYHDNSLCPICQINTWCADVNGRMDFTPGAIEPRITRSNQMKGYVPIGGDVRRMILKGNMPQIYALCSLMKGHALMHNDSCCLIRKIRNAWTVLNCTICLSK